MPFVVELTDVYFILIAPTYSLVLTNTDQLDGGQT